MFLDKLISAIGNFFVGLFNAAKKVWNNLSPAIQDAMLQGSGIVAILNENVGKEGSVLLALIKTTYPGVDENKLKAALNDVAGYLKIGEDLNDTDLVTMLEKIAEHLDTTTGSTWAQTSHDIYLILSKLFAPEGTKLTILIQLGEYVYHKFIKKD